MSATAQLPVRDVNYGSALGEVVAVGPIFMASRQKPVISLRVKTEYRRSGEEHIKRREAIDVALLGQRAFELENNLTPGLRVEIEGYFYRSEVRLGDQCPSVYLSDEQGGGTRTGLCATKLDILDPTDPRPDRLHAMLTGEVLDRSAVERDGEGPFLRLMLDSQFNYSEDGQLIQGMSLMTLVVRGELALRALEEEPVGTGVKIEGYPTVCAQQDWPAGSRSPGSSKRSADLSVEVTSLDVLYTAGEATEPYLF